MNELETKVVQHEEQIKTLFNKTSRLENITTELNKLAMSVEKLAINQSAMIEQQKSLREDIDQIKEQPTKDAKEIKMTIIKCIITGVLSALVGAILALVIRGGI